MCGSVVKVVDFQLIGSNERAVVSCPPCGPCPYRLGFVYYAGRGSDEWVDGRSVFLLSLFIVYRICRPSSSKAKRGGTIGQCFVYNLMSLNIQELTETALDASSCIGRTLNVLLPGRLHANSPAAFSLTDYMML